MTWEIVVGIGTLIGFGVAVITPIVKLNSSITKLNCSIDELNSQMAKSDRRLDAHGHQIDTNTQDIAILRERIEQIKQELHRG